MRTDSSETAATADTSAGLATASVVAPSNQRDGSPASKPALTPEQERRLLRPIDKQRLAPGQLLALAGQLLASPAGGRSVLIVISMNRSDRLQALGQQPSSREVMIEVVKRIRSILRSHDRYAIASHEEIWMLLADLPSASLAELAVRTLQQSLGRPIHARTGDGDETVVQLRPAVGAAWTVESSNTDPMILLTAATEAVKQAVRAEDRVYITRLETDDALLNRHTLEHDLRIALQNNELEVHFQPQIELRTNRCVAVEALIRWNDAKRGAISPQVIAMLCEERGMMAQLTHFVLNTTLRHMMFWRGQNINVNVAINISAMSLADPTFPTQVAQALSTWGADARRLTLELTESSIVENEHGALDFMNQLAAMGCRLSIDDFGTGYSSLAYLRQFPLNELKIDQTFVKHITDEHGDRRIVQVLVDLAHTFDMRALAEGVESDNAAQLLRELGCDLAQGYFYSPPLPAKAFVEWFRQRGDTSPPLEGENIDARPSRPSSALAQRIATEGVAAHGPATVIRGAG